MSQLRAAITPPPAPPSQDELAERMATRQRLIVQRVGRGNVHLQAGNYRTAADVDREVEQARAVAI